MDRLHLRRDRRERTLCALAGRQRRRRTQVTSGADTYYYQPIWSPDSKKLLWSDRLQRLRYVDVDSKAVTQVDQDKFGEIESYDWSPDSQWIAWARPEENEMPKVYLYSLAEQDSRSRSQTIGTARAMSVFSDDGKYLLFSSARDFKPTFGERRNSRHVYRDMERIYLVTLAEGHAIPLAPKSDEVGNGERRSERKDKADRRRRRTKKPDDGKATDEKKEAPKKPVVVKVDPTGSAGPHRRPANHAGELPRHPRRIDDRIFYLRRTTADDGRTMTMTEAATAARRRTFAFYNLEDRKETVLGDVERVSRSRSTARRCWSKSKKITPSSICRRTRSKPRITSCKIEGLDMQLDRHAEWNQIYFEAWRQMRDFFYAPNMNGVDWKAMRDKYAALLPFVNHRNDLTYLLGELIAELNNGHAYVGGGERPDVDRASSSACSAPSSRATRRRKRLSNRTHSAGRKLGQAHALAADRDRRERQSWAITSWPINGTPVSKLPNLYDALIGTAGQAGHPAGEFQTGGRRRARCHRRADRGRSAALLSRLGAEEHRRGIEEDERRGRLRAHSRHGPAGLE